MRENMAEVKINIRDMLDQLLQIEPNNRFYRKLSTRWVERKTLTRRQIEKLRKEYLEKLANLVTTNMQKVEARSNVIQSVNITQRD